MTNNNKPQAFPSNQNNTGMTLRDYFASKAMQSYMIAEIWKPDGYKMAAEASYQVADAMLKAREA
jgi:hypothetical protein